MLNHSIAIEGAPGRRLPFSHQRPFLVYLGIGLAVTVVFEHLATQMLDRWAYAEAAPVLPGLGTRLAPLLQWLLLPPLVLSLTRRQLIGATHMNPSNRE